MKLSDARSNTTPALQARVITERSKRQTFAFAVLCPLSGKLVSSELSRLLLRSSKEPEIVPDLTQKLSLWQRLEWSSGVRRRHLQESLFDNPPKQLEFEI